MQQICHSLAGYSLKKPLFTPSVLLLNFSNMNITNMLKTAHDFQGVLCIRHELIQQVRTIVGHSSTKLTHILTKSLFLKFSMPSKIFQQQLPSNGSTYKKATIPLLCCGYFQQTPLYIYISIHHGKRSTPTRKLSCNCTILAIRKLTIQSVIVKLTTQIYEGQTSLSKPVLSRTDSSLHFHKHTARSCHGLTT